MKFAFLFPGQGSQSVGMMSGFGEHPVVRETFAEASDILKQDMWALDGALLRRFGYAADLLIAGVGAGNCRNDRGFRPWRQEILFPVDAARLLQAALHCQTDEPFLSPAKELPNQSKMPIVSEFVASSLSASPK